MAGCAVTFLGSGDAFHAGGRGHSCYLVEDALGAVAVDFGATALAALRRLAKDSAALDAILVTHLHGDHFAGLPFLLLDAVHRHRRERPLIVAGPPGIEARVRALTQACYGDVLAKARFDLRFMQWQEGREIAVAGRLVLPVPALHPDPPERAFSLRVTTGGVVVAFTGDTGRSDALADLAAGADLFVAECALWDEDYDRHLRRADWEDLLPRLSCPLVAFTHMGDGALAHADELLRLPHRAGTRLVLGEDLLRLEFSRGQEQA